MSHTHENSAELLKRIKRIKGQLEGVERMLIDNAPCYEVLQSISAARGAINGFMSELLEDHIQHHLVEEKNPTKVRKAGDEIVKIVRSFFR